MIYYIVLEAMVGLPCTRFTGCSSLYYHTIHCFWPYLLAKWTHMHKVQRQLMPTLDSSLFNVARFWRFQCSIPAAVFRPCILLLFDWFNWDYPILFQVFIWLNSNSGIIGLVVVVLFCVLCNMHWSLGNCSHFYPNNAFAQLRTVILYSHLMAVAVRLRCIQFLITEDKYKEH